MDLRSFLMVSMTIKGAGSPKRCRVRCPKSQALSAFERLSHNQGDDLTTEYAERAEAWLGEFLTTENTEEAESGKKTRRVLDQTYPPD